MKRVEQSYSSFQALAEAWGIKKHYKPDPQKQEKFAGKCRVCGQPLSFVGGNVMVCQNPDCKGVVHKEYDDEGNSKEVRSSYYRLLDDKGARIAERLFANG